VLSLSQLFSCGRVRLGVKAGLHAIYPRAGALVKGESILLCFLLWCPPRNPRGVALLY
jgi:hypothetical protein